MDFKNFVALKQQVDFFEQLLDESVSEPLDEALSKKVGNAISKMKESPKAYGREYYNQEMWKHTPYHRDHPEYDSKNRFLGGRLTMPLEHDDAHPDVRNFLHNHGYQISDYKNGLATKTIQTGKPDEGIPLRNVTRTVKIGKVLDAHSAPDEIKKAFVNKSRESGTDDERSVVISHDAHDVGSMSSCKSWSSCMDLDRGKTSYNSHIKNDIQHGTHVAYQVKKGDDPLDHAEARIAIKPHIGLTTGKTVLRPENKGYGSPVAGFQSHVEKFFDKHHPLGNELYIKHPDLYNDGGRHGQITHREGYKPTSVDVTEAYKKLKGNKNSKGIALSSILPFVKDEHKYKSPDLKMAQDWKSPANTGRGNEDFKTALDNHEHTYNDMRNHGLYGHDIDERDGIEHALFNKMDTSNPEHVAHLVKHLNNKNASNAPAAIRDHAFKSMRHYDTTDDVKKHVDFQHDIGKHDGRAPSELPTINEKLRPNLLKQYSDKHGFKDGGEYEDISNIHHRANHTDRGDYPGIELDVKNKKDGVNVPETVFKNEAERFLRGAHYHAEKHPWGKENGFKDEMRNRVSGLSKDAKDAIAPHLPQHPDEYIKQAKEIDPK